ncbi:MAG: DDE-type integrase/transposase/recombinase, partial [Bdellovibrionales bacterium]|nr:DDE-type integrase/transposase/recombinase [Bdellovibrionales bacterium]
MSETIARGIYKTYTTQTKLELIKSGNPNHFVDEGVPRTTAIHWLKNSYKLENLESQPNKFYETKIKHLEQKLLKESTLKNLLVLVRELHPYSFDKKKVRKKAIKLKILQEISNVQKIVNLNTCLNTIGLSPSTYYRWMSICHQCQRSDKKCSKRRPNQLTSEEINTMKYYVTNKKYSHIAVSSLCELAKRDGKLFCSVHTWYKYINLFEWIRPKPKKIKKRYPKGIKTTYPNHVWHVDVSEFIFLRKKYYFQAVIDNYSRYILAWILTETKEAKNTVALLQMAKLNLKNIPTHLVRLIADGGGENIAGIVTQFISRKNIQRLIAQQDIEHSNSMIECFFRSLKNNYFYHQKIRTVEDIRRKIAFYVKQHNEVIPKP